MSSTTTFWLIFAAVFLLWGVICFWMMYHIFNDERFGRWMIALLVLWAGWSVGFGYLFWWLDVRWGISCPHCKEWGIQ